MKELILLKDLGMQYPNANSKQKRRYGLYKCFCGKEFRGDTYSVKVKSTKSCGCFKKEIMPKMKEKHGMSKQRLYSIWRNMKTRCYNKKYEKAHCYSNRGIRICEEWLNDFNSFKTWSLKNGYCDNLSIDRINNDGSYEPSNCRWTTSSVQATNTQKLRKDNKSGYRGVTYLKGVKKYVVKISVNKKRITIGYFKCRLQGAYAYDNYVKENKLNHPTNF